MAGIGVTVARPAPPRPATCGKLERRTEGPDGTDEVAGGAGRAGGRWVSNANDFVASGAPRLGAVGWRRGRRGL